MSLNGLGGSGDGSLLGGTGDGDLPLLGTLVGEGDLLLLLAVLICVNSIDSSCALDVEGAVTIGSGGGGGGLYSGGM